MKTKKTFVGNDTLLGLYDSLSTDYPEADFYITSTNTLEDVLSNVDKYNYNVVISIDTVFGISYNDYMNIISLLDNHEVYIVFIYNQPFNFNNKNIHTINFYEELNNNSNYWAVDYKHLSNDGNISLKNLIDNSFINKKKSLSGRSPQ